MSACPWPHAEIVRGPHEYCTAKGYDATSSALSLRAVLDACPAVDADFTPVHPNDHSHGGLEEQLFTQL